MRRFIALLGIGLLAMAGTAQAAPVSVQAVTTVQDRP